MSEIPEEIRKMFPDQAIHKMDIDNNGNLQVLSSCEPLIDDSYTGQITALRIRAERAEGELHTLRFKESQEQRFIWWIWNVYAKNVNDLILSIISATTYDNETMAKLGKYGLPIKCFEIMERVKGGTDRIYDGTYLDVEISTDVKTSSDNNKPSDIEVSVTQDVLINSKTSLSIEK